MKTDEDLDEEAPRALMVIPLMWAAKMILANVEFLHDMQGMPLDDIRDRKRN